MRLEEFHEWIWLPAAVVRLLLVVLDRAKKSDASKDAGARAKRREKRKK